MTIEVDKKEFAAVVRDRKLTHLIDLGLSGGQEASMAVVREYSVMSSKTTCFCTSIFSTLRWTKKSRSTARSN